jgi:hypothetical protein
VEVADRGGPGVPELRQADRVAEDGRGLGLVARLAARWGWRRRGRQMVTWFEIQALLQPMQHSAVSGKGICAWAVASCRQRPGGSPTWRRKVAAKALGEL